MRINPICTNNVAFGQIKSPTKGVSKEIFEGKEEVLDFVSEDKHMDIWAFKRNKGGMYNPSVGYIILVQDQKTGNVIKEVEGDQSELSDLVKRVEDTLVWYEPLKNIALAQSIKNTNIPKHNPKEVTDVASNLLKAAMSNESSDWERKVKNI